jgi:hypothetical protein
MVHNFLTVFWPLTCTKKSSSKLSALFQDVLLRFLSKPKKTEKYIYQRHRLKIIKLPTKRCMISLRRHMSKAKPKGFHLTIPSST